MRTFRSHFAPALALFLVFAAAAACVGCATTQPKNAGQAVLQAYADYTMLAEGAAAYGRFPFCDAKPAGTLVCADRTLVLQIQVVRDNTLPIIKSAKEASLQPGFNGSAAERWVTIANGALKALQEICTNPANVNLCVAQPPRP